MASDRDGGDPQPKRIIYQMRERLTQAQNQWFREARDGGASLQTKLDYAEAVVEYENVLREHRDESVVADSWPDISDIREKFGRKTTVWEVAPGDTTNERRVTKPAVAAVSAERLHEAADALNRAAKRLGLAASVSERPETSKFDQQDLVTLLGVRGQEDALAEAPEDVTERVVDTLDGGGDGE